MTQEKAGFGEQAVNKLIEVVLARLVDAEHLQVRIKANLKNLAGGEVDAIAIQMWNVLLRPNLRVAHFQFDIDSAVVSIQSAMFRKKIELLRPATGLLKIVINQQQLSASLNAESLCPSNHKQDKVQQVSCELQAEGAISFHFSQPQAAAGFGTCTTMPRIEPDNTVVLEKQGVQTEPPSEFVNSAITHISNILSLVDLANQGATFHIQKLDVKAGSITVQASAHIEQFPSA